MKKLKKMTVNVIQDNYPVMNKEQLSSVLGGYGPGDCMFQSIAQATGYSVDYVQQVFTTWALQNEDWFYGGTYTSAYNTAAEYGVILGDASSWLLNYFGMTQTQTPIGSFYDGSGNGGVMMMYAYDQNGDMYGHAVNFLYGDINGNYYYYDAQQGVYGSVSAYGDDNWNVWGVYH